MAFSLLLVAIGTAWLVSGWIVGEDSRTLILAGLGFTVGGIALIILGNWRTGFYLFIVWLLFEDMMRKFMGNNMAIYFAKDVLVGITYVSFLFAMKRGEVRTFRPPFMMPLAFFAWLGIAQVFNPNSPSLLYGVLGLKLYLWYVPLLFVGYALIDSEKDLYRLLVLNLALAGLIAGLGVIQAIVGPEFLNPRVLAPELETLGHLYRTAPVSGQRIFRPSSVFVSDGRFASYLLLMWLLGFGTLGYQVLRRIHRGRKVAFLAVTLVFAAVLLSGLRAVFLHTLASAFILAAGFLWGSPWHWQAGHRLFRAVHRGFAFAGFGLIALLLLFPSALGARWAFYSETLSPESPGFELVWRAWDYPIRNFLLAFEHPDWPIGYGIGVTSLGGQYASRFLGIQRTMLGVESGFGTLIVEMGILGLLFWIAWAIALLRSAWSVVYRLRRTSLFPVGFSIWWFIFLVLFPFTYTSIAAYQNFVLNAYLWLLVGVLFRLPTLELEERLQAGQARLGVYGS